MLHADLKKPHPFQHHSSSPSQDPTGDVSPVTVTALCCAPRKKTSEKLSSGNAGAVDTFKISCCTHTVMCGEGDMQPASAW